jgi:hypothetical protein
MIPADMIPQHHIKRRRRTALLAVTLDANTLQVRTTEQESFDLVRVAVVVEVNGPVRREEGVKVSVLERAGGCLRDQGS